MNISIRAETRRWLGLAVLCSAFFMVILDVAIVNVALPSIAADLDFSPRSLQWVVSAYALTFGGLLLLGGRAADVLGQRRTFVGGVAVFALASLLGGLAWSPAMLVTARARPAGSRPRDGTSVALRPRARRKGRMIAGEASACCRAERTAARPRRRLALPYRAFTPREPPHGLLHPTPGNRPGDVEKGGNMKRTLMMLTLAGVGVLASATAAEAGVVRNTTVSYAYAGWVPCADSGAGELVTGTIDAHLLDTSTVNDGVDAWQFMFAPRGTLVGETTGDTYRLTGIQRGTYVNVAQSDQFVLTYVNRYQLIGPGSGNNLVVRETAHITSSGGDPVVQFDDYSVECG